MRRLLVTIIAIISLVSPLSAFAAISFNNYAELNEPSATNTSTVSITATGSNGLVVATTIASGGFNCTGVTFDGHAMTQIASVAVGGGSNRTLQMWYYLAGTFSGGSVNVVFSYSGSTNNFPEERVSTYAGVAQSGQPDASNSYSAQSGSSAATNVTTIADNSWVVSATRDSAVGVSGISGGTDRTTVSGMHFGDSNAAVTPAGSKTITWSFAGATTYGAIIASFAPATGAAVTAQTSILGLVNSFWLW